MISQSASDNAFTWLLGGGADYRFSGHWYGRAKLDLERTHFSDTGQSRLRFVLGVAYTFGDRGKAEAAAAERKGDEEAVAEAKRQADEQVAAAAQMERAMHELRARLLENFNGVLPTTDRPRALVIDIAELEVFRFVDTELKEVNVDYRPNIYVWFLEIERSLRNAC